MPNLLTYFAANQMKELFVTNVGSHMWQMNHSGSDVDLFVAVLAPTKSILRGEFDDQSKVEYSGPMDRQYHELGRIVDQVLRNNWNYLSGVMSPIIVKDWSRLADLRHLTTMNYSKRAYHSIKGLALHNYEKWDCQFFGCCLVIASGTSNCNVQGMADYQIRRSSYELVMLG